MTNYKAFITYILVDYTPYTEEFAKIDSVANIVSQISIQHNLVYRKDFHIAELGIDSMGRQLVKIDFLSEELAMLVKLKGLDKV